MQKTTFVILSGSHIIRKGISAIVTGMENTLIYDELESPKDLDLASPYHIPDFLIVDFNNLNGDGIAHIRTYVTKFNLELIGIQKGKFDGVLPMECKFCIDLYEAEEGIKKKLKICTGVTEMVNAVSHKGNVMSEREKEVLKLVAMGMTNKEIGDKLFISLHTVITHRKNITKKLGIKTVSGLTVYAILNNIIEMRDIER